MKKHQLPQIAAVMAEEAPAGRMLRRPAATEHLARL